MLTLPSFDTATVMRVRFEAGAKRTATTLCEYYRGAIYDQFNTELWICPHKHDGRALATNCGQIKLARLGA